MNLTRFIEFINRNAVTKVENLNSGVAADLTGVDYARGVVVLDKGQSNSVVKIQTLLNQYRLIIGDTGHYRKANNESFRNNVLVKYENQNSGFNGVIGKIDVVNPTMKVTWANGSQNSYHDINWARDHIFPIYQESVEDKYEDLQEVVRLTAFTQAHKDASHACALRAAAKELLAAAQDLLPMPDLTGVATKPVGGENEYMVLIRGSNTARGTGGYWRVHQIIHALGYQAAFDEVRLDPSIRFKLVLVVG